MSEWSGRGRVRVRVREGEGGDKKANKQTTIPTNYFDKIMFIGDTEDVHK